MLPSEDSSDVAPELPDTQLPGQLLPFESVDNWARPAPMIGVFATDDNSPDRTIVVAEDAAHLLLRHGREVLGEDYRSRVQHRRSARARPGP